MSASYIDCLRSTIAAGNGPWDPRWLTYSRSTIAPTIAECLRHLGANKLAAQAQVTRAELAALINGVNTPPFIDHFNRCAARCYPAGKRSRVRMRQATVCDVVHAPLPVWWYLDCGPGGLEPLNRNPGEYVPCGGAT